VIFGYRKLRDPLGNDIAIHNLVTKHRFDKRPILVPTFR
jgi:hypothetical protein